MKAILIVLTFALMCAFAFGQICIPVPFSLSHIAQTTSTIVPGLIDLYTGYQFVINGLTSDAQVTISDLTVTFSAICSHGVANATILYHIPDGTYTVPANSGSWNPTQMFFAGFQSGPMKTNDVCGMNAPYTINGATLSGGLVSSETSLPVSIRFAYFSFIDLAQYIPTGLPSLPGVHPREARDAQPQAVSNQQLNAGNAPVRFGEDAYSSPTSVTAQICLSLSILPPGIPTYSTTDTKSVTPSFTPTFSGTPSQSVSITQGTSTLRITKRRFLKRG